MTNERDGLTLKPCPFCGSKATAYDDGEDCIASCNNEKCEIIPSVVGCKTVQEAADKWNARALAPREAGQAKLTREQRALIERAWHRLSVLGDEDLAMELCNLNDEIWDVDRLISPAPITSEPKEKMK